MTIQRAILIIATDKVAATLNPVAQLGIREIAEWQRRGDYSAKQAQSADDVAISLSAKETERVFRRAKEIKEMAE